MPEVTGCCTNGGVGEWASLILWLEIMLLTMKTAATTKHTLKITHFEVRMGVHLSRNHWYFKRNRQIPIHRVAKSDALKTI